MRGRRPSGPDYVDHLPGSQTAKARLKVVLETLAGSCRVLEACARLGICEQRFHQLRQQALEAALTGLEPGPRGRPPHQPLPADERLEALQEQIEAMEVELRAARAREEIALVVPNARQPADEHTAEKKTRRRPRKNRFRPPGTRKNT